MTTDVSPELKDLLERKLDTFEKLELVIALRAASRPLTVADLALQLQVGREALRRVVDGLADDRMIEKLADDAVRLTSNKWDPQIEEAAALQKSEPAQLMTTFTRIAMERIRGMAARTFADAFLIRKKKDD